MNLLYYSTAQRYLALNSHEKRIEKLMHMHAIFSNAHKKCAQKKLINIYVAVFCLTLKIINYYRLGN